MDDNNNSTRKIFTRTSFGSAKDPKAPMVHVTTGDGRVTFNSVAVAMMGLKAGDRIFAVRDDPNVKRYGFVVTDRPDGFSVTPSRSSRTAKSLCIHSKALVRQMDADVDAPGGNLCAQIGRQRDDDGTWWVLESSWRSTPKRMRRNGTS